MLMKFSKPSTTEVWESGFQSVGPPRCQKLWIPLTQLDHPKWLWELRKLDSSPHQPEHHRTLKLK
jgi:hypothetical protein